MEDLANLVIVNGVNDRLEGFVTITAQGSKGTLLVGQLSIEECREHGILFISIAEAAQQDAVAFKVLKNLFPEEGMAEKLAGLIITKLREEREGGADTE
jgi:hypothetical protein